MGKKAKVQPGRVAKGGVAMTNDRAIATEKKGRTPGMKYAVDVLGTSKGRKMK